MNTFDDKLFEVVKDVDEVKNQINEIINDNSTNNCGMNWIHVEYEYKKGGGTGATTGIAIAKLENDDKVYKFDVLVREKELDNDSEEVVISGFTYNSEVYLPYVNRVKTSTSSLILEKRDGLLGIVRDYPLYDGIMIVEGRTTITQEEAVGLELKNTGESISLVNRTDNLVDLSTRVSAMDTEVPLIIKEAQTEGTSYILLCKSSVNVFFKGIICFNQESLASIVDLVINDNDSYAYGDVYPTQIPTLGITLSVVGCKVDNVRYVALKVVSSSSQGSGTWQIVGGRASDPSVVKWLSKDEAVEELPSISHCDLLKQQLQDTVREAHPVGSIVWVTTDEEPNLGGVWEKVTGLTETTIFAYKRTA